MEFTKSEIENIETFFDDEEIGSKMVFYNGDDANVASSGKDFSIMFTGRGALVINDSRGIYKRYDEVGFDTDLMVLAGYNENDTPEYYLIEQYGVDEVEFLED